MLKSALICVNLWIEGCLCFSPRPCAKIWVVAPLYAKMGLDGLAFGIYQNMDWRFLGEVWYEEGWGAESGGVILRCFLFLRNLTLTEGCEMKRKLVAVYVLFFAMGLILSGLSAFAAETPRQKVNFNREWKFKLGDEKGAEVTAFEDKEWGNVGLPHSFSIPYFESDKFYTGYGWYRKHFDAPKDWQGKRVNIEFEGAFQVAEVYVNGKQVGQHEGGYTGFALDITDAVKTGDNVVAVRLNNLWKADLAPRGGEHVFSGGIYRDVYLVVTDPVHVDWYGTFITTPEVSNESATVNIKTDVKNDSAKSQKATVLTRLMDAAGKEAAKIESSVTVEAGKTETLEQKAPAIKNQNFGTRTRPICTRRLRRFRWRARLLISMKPRLVSVPSNGRRIKECF